MVEDSHRDYEPEDLTPVEDEIANESDPLLGGVKCRFSMVCRPSFSPSYAVAITCDDSGGLTDTVTHQQPGAWSVRTAINPPKVKHVVRAKKNAETPVIQRSNVVIDEKSALAVLDGVSSVVRRAREPKPLYDTLADGTRIEVHTMHIDGVDYRFECGPFRGMAFMPTKGLPAGIVGLAEELRTLALTDEGSRAAQLERCLELAKGLQAEAEKRP